MRGVLRAQTLESLRYRGFGSFCPRAIKWQSDKGVVSHALNQQKDVPHVVPRELVNAVCEMSPQQQMPF